MHTPDDFSQSPRPAGSNTCEDAESFVTLDLTAVGDLGELYDSVALAKGRVVITREGCDDACVIISRSELESLEESLELLSDGDGVRAMHETIRATFARLRPALTT